MPRASCAGLTGAVFVGRISRRRCCRGGCLRGLLTCEQAHKAQSGPDASVEAIGAAPLDGPFERHDATAMTLGLWARRTCLAHISGLGFAIPRGQPRDRLFNMLQFAYCGSLIGDTQHVTVDISYRKAHG
jgi:hypothetical protein